MVTSANRALSQVIHGLRRAGLRAGHTVVIQGAGGLGLDASWSASPTSSARPTDAPPGRRGPVSRAAVAIA